MWARIKLLNILNYFSIMKIAPRQKVGVIDTIKEVLQGGKTCVSRTGGTNVYTKITFFLFKRQSTRLKRLFILSSSKKFMHLIRT